MNQKIIATGILAGIGLGGFIDGIVFHQIFQKHSMLSAKIDLSVLANLKASMFWDGIFHVFVWVATFISVLLIINLNGQIRGKGRLFFGSSIMGWGIFNLVEGLADHHLFGLHNVIQSHGLSVYDYLFLLSGIAFIALGYMINRSAKRIQPINIETTIRSINTKKVIIAGLLLGTGLGGMLEGILFFQVFQLHSMISAILPPVTVENVRGSMFWDGVYHLFTWLLTTLAISKTFIIKSSISKFPSATYWGASLVGLGGLNIIEAIIDHHLFSIHHVVERLGLSFYDYAFLIISAIIVIIGSLIIRSETQLVSISD